MMPVPGLSSIRAPETGLTPEVGEQLASLSAPQEPTLSSSLEGVSCDLDQIYNVIGFNENSNDLTPRLMQRVHHMFIEDRRQKRCRVTVTGYLDAGIARDERTLRRRAGVRMCSLICAATGSSCFQRASAVGGGATEQSAPSSRSTAGS